MGAGKLRAAWLAAIVSLLAPPAAAGPAPTYGFEFFTYPDADFTGVVGVRGDGVAVGQFIVLGPTPPVIGQPADILERGVFTWDGNAFAPVALPQPEARELDGANGAGVLWGRNGDHGFVLGPGGLVEVAHPDYHNTYLTGVDAAGLVYGIRSNDDPNADPNAPLRLAIDPGSFVFDGTSFSDLVLPGIDVPIVEGVRSDGLVWGTDPDLGAYLFDGTHFSVIDAPGDEIFNLIQGVSDAGLVLGSQFTGTSSHFLFDGVDYHPFEIPGDFGFAQGINGNGVIWGQSSLGAFLATPLPEPGSALLVALGIALALRARRR